ncbi:MAG: hypothetical protein NTY09_07425 [bacterium]|nr:hypothetical protein [bacterium]
MDIITIYWILFFVGLGFAVISAILVGFGAATGGHDVDFSGTHDIGLGSGADSANFGAGAHGDFQPHSGDFYHGEGEIGFSPISPSTIAAFVCGFGGGGLIGNALGLATWGSVLLAVLIGIFSGGIVYFLIFKLSQLSASSEARASEIIGTTAEIITPIVGDNTGEIAYVSRGSRYNSPARSLDGKSITRGAAVKIWRLVGSTAYVKEIPPEEAEQPAVDLND